MKVMLQLFFGYLIHIAVAVLILLLALDALSQSKLVGTKSNTKISQNSMEIN